MIDLYVNGQAIELPEDISMDYVAENRLFSNADGYSLDIDVPLRDSKINSEIFGCIWRPDADVKNARFSAVIVTPQVTLSGIVAVVSLSESTITLQFLEGRSVQNFEKDLEELYVNELDLGTFNTVSGNPTPYDCWKSIDDGASAVAIPWVNDNSGIVQNNVIKQGNSWTWDPENRGKSFMPYLCVVIHKICDAVGYACDIAELEESRFRHLLLCNVLPAALAVPEYASALPRWTVNEFFENLEIILCGEFDIDNVLKKISFRFTENILSEIEPVDLGYDVVDEFSADLTLDDEDRQDLDLLKNISFQDNGSRFWKIHSCDWFVKLRKKNPNSGEGWVMPGTGYIVGDDGHRRPAGDRIYKSLVEFDTMEEFVSKFKAYEYFGFHRNDIVQHNLYYVKEFDCYFIYHATDYVEIQGKGWYYHFELIPVNVFGNYIVDTEDDDNITISTVPVPVDMAEFPCAFIYFSNSSDNSVDADEQFNLGSDESPWDSSGNLTPEAVEERKGIQPLVYQSIEKGEENQSAYFDKLYLGFWEGYKPYHEQIGIRPITANVVIYDYFKYMSFPDFSLRLNHGFSRGCDEYLSIDSKKVYKFSFLSDRLPSPRATYYINGKKYVCAKLQASFSADGMSKLIKGEFYRI